MERLAGLLPKSLDSNELGVAILYTRLLILQQKVQLADLLLLFIYTEVLGMVAIFYKSRRIPILLPLFIAITALSRMIILQGKGSDPQNLLYEAGAVLLLAIACFIVTHKNVSKAEDFDFNSEKSN